MRTSKIVLAAGALTAAAVFAAGSQFATTSIVQPAAAATAAIDTTGYMPVGFITDSTSGYGYFLRLGNAASTSATFTVLVASEAGSVGATTLTYTVPAYGMMTVAGGKLISDSGSSGSATRKSVYVKSDLAGKGAVVQIVVVNPNSTLSPQTHCVFDSSASYDATVGKVFMGLTGPAFGGYSTFLWITNPDSKSRVVGGSYYDAKTGSHLDELYTGTIPANGSLLVAVNQSSAQTLADAKNPSAATALPGLAAAKDYVNLVLRSGDSSPLTAVVNPVLINPNGTIVSISEFCPINPTKSGGTAANPSGS
jgi:hypothetical protein